MAPLAPVDAALADSADIAAPPAASDVFKHQLESHPEQEKETFMARVVAAMNGITRNNNNSSGSGSGSSLGTLKPPKPPSSQARKQIRLLPKQREQSPVQVLSNGHSNTLTRNTHHNTNNYTPRATNYNSSTSQSLSTSGLGNCQQQTTESHYEVSLKLPLSTGTGTSAAATASASDAAADRLRLLTRSPSPAYSISSRCSTQSSVSRTSRLETPPRRVFPQTYTRGSGLDPYEMRQLESSPVVFDANLSFVLGCQRQPVHQTLRPTPSFEDPRTSSAYLSEKIQNFLKRTDHVQEEWTAMGRRTRRQNNNSSNGSINGAGGGYSSRCSTPSGSSAYYDDYDTISLIERQRERNSMERCGSVGRTRSTQNILTKAFQLSKQLPHTPTSRGNSMARESSVATSVMSNAINGDDDDDRTIREEDDNELDEVASVADVNLELAAHLICDFSVCVGS